MLILLIIVVLLLCGGGGYYGSRAGWGPSQFGTGGVVGLLLLAILVYLLLTRHSGL